MAHRATRHLHLVGPIAVAASLIATVGCGSSSPAKPVAADCQAACEHMLRLAMEDIDRSLAETAKTAPDLAASMSGLKTKAAASRESDLATCQSQCMSGRLNTRCTRAATTIDDVSACTDRRGGQR